MAHGSCEGLNRFWTHSAFRAEESGFRSVQTFMSLTLNPKQGLDVASSWSWGKAKEFGLRGLGDARFVYASLLAYGSFRKLGGTLFGGVLLIRILLFRVPYYPPIFGNPHIGRAGFGRV